MFEKVKLALKSETAKNIAKDVLTGVTTYVAIIGLSLVVGTIAAVVQEKIWPSSDNEVTEEELV